MVCGGALVGPCNEGRVSSGGYRWLLAGGSHQGGGGEGVLQDSISCEST
jgi:hypothetical protein